VVRLYEKRILKIGTGTFQLPVSYGFGGIFVVLFVSPSRVDESLLF